MASCLSSCLSRCYRRWCENPVAAPIQQPAHRDIPAHIRPQDPVEPTRTIIKVAEVRQLRIDMLREKISKLGKELLVAEQVLSWEQGRLFAKLHPDKVVIWNDTFKHGPPFTGTPVDTRTIGIGMANKNIFINLSRWSQILPPKSNGRPNHLFQSLEASTPATTEAMILQIVKHCDKVNGCYDKVNSPFMQARNDPHKVIDEFTNDIDSKNNSPSNSHSAGAGAVASPVNHQQSQRYHAGRQGELRNRSTRSEGASVGAGAGPGPSMALIPVSNNDGPIG